MWTSVWDVFPPGIMSAEGWGRIKREILALPQQKDPCGSVTPRWTSWVLPLQEGCQLPRRCIAVQGLQTLWNGDNKSWPNPNYRMHVQVKWYSLCEDARTPEFILLSLGCFLSFRLIFPVLVRPDLSNMTCPQTSSPIPTFAFLPYEKLLHNLP